MQGTEPDVRSIPESDVTTASEVLIPEEVLETFTADDFDSDGTTASDVVEEDEIMPDEVLEMCTRNDFDSDGMTLSDVGEEGDAIPDEILEMCTRQDFDSDRTTISDVDEDDNDFSQWTDSMDALVASFDQTAENPAGIGVSQNSCETVGTRSTLFDSPATQPHQSGAGLLAGNTTSPSKRPLELTFDTSQGPPTSRQRQIVDVAVGDVQSEVSPLRKTLTSKLSLRLS